MKLARFSAALIFWAMSWGAISAQEFGTGCILDAQKYAQAPLAPTLTRGNYGNLPKKTSLRRYAPTPQNQGKLGTCVGWSTAYAARTIMFAQQEGWESEPWITTNAFSPYFIYEQAKASTDNACLKGTSLLNGLEIVKQIGVVKLAEFGNQCGQTITGQLEKKAHEFRIKEYRRLFEENAPNKTALVKKSLTEGKPIVIGIQCCTQSFIEAKGVKYWTLKPGEDANPTGGHALTVIGYDDALNGGSFELMNSWGTAWGDGGFIWMKYTDFNRYCFEAYEMIPETSNKQLLAADVRFVQSNGEEMKAVWRGKHYEFEKPYHSGTTFQITITNHAQMYVYVFGTDLSKQNYKIFPPSPKINPYLDAPNSSLALPSEQQYLALDTNTGTDYFCFLFSSEKLDFAALLNRIQAAEGDLPQRIQSVLGDRLLDNDEVSYEPVGNVRFRGLSAKHKIVPVVLALQHIE